MWWRQLRLGLWVLAASSLCVYMALFLYLRPPLHSSLYSLHSLHSLPQSLYQQIFGTRTLETTLHLSKTSKKNPNHNNPNNADNMDNQGPMGTMNHVNHVPSGEYSDRSVSLSCAKGLTGLRDIKINPFQDTLLDTYVTYPWRPCLKEWQFGFGSRNYTLINTPPVIFKMFDWVVWQHDRENVKPLITLGNHSKNNNPRTVLAYPEVKSMNALKRFLKRVKHLESGQRRSLVIAGQDSGLAGRLQKFIHTNLLDYFSDIWCTAKNKKDPFINTIPLGLNPYYIVKAGIEEVTKMVRSQVQPHYDSIDVSPYRRKLWSFGHVMEDIFNPPQHVTFKTPSHNKRKLVFAAWGSVWRSLDDTLKDRVSLISFLLLPSTQQWLNRSSFDMLEYWEQLSAHKFSICPPGNGVQTPKIFEAILMNTVPVTLRRPAFEDLQDMGFPILLVNDWTDLNEKFLLNAYEDKYKNTDWERAKRRMSAVGIMKTVLNCKKVIPRDSQHRANVSMRVLDEQLIVTTRPRMVVERRNASMSFKSKFSFSTFSLNAYPDPGPRHQCDTQLRLQSRPNPFIGTLLNDVVSYHWRPCQASWKFEHGSRNHSLFSTPPVMFNHFDWVIWQHSFDEHRHAYVVFTNNTDSMNNPRTVLVHPNKDSLHVLSKLLRGLVKKRSNLFERRTLVIAGEDSGLGGNVQYRAHRYLLDYFSDIWVTAKDRPDPYIRTIPLGLNPYYLVKAGLSQVTRILQDETYYKRDRKLVFTAWGSMWRFLDDTLKDRVSLVAFLQLPATQKWLKRSDLGMLEYWEQLSTHKFSVCPPGNGVQTPKIYEAILAHTVPITLRRPAFEDLKSLGVPLLLVDEWTYLNATYLENVYETDFKHVDWAWSKKLLSPTGVMDMLINWNDTIPLHSPKRMAVSKKINQAYLDSQHKLN